MTQFAKILLPVDFSGHSARALDYAVELAQQFGSKIYLLHSYPIHVGSIAPYGIVVPESFERDCREVATKQLDEWAKKVSDRDIEVESLVTPTFVCDAIVKQAEEIGADLIVMGTRGLGDVKHVLMGSVTERTIRVAPCPVLTV